MSKATQETEHLKEMLVGNILSVSWSELAKTAGLYALVGLFHFVLRQKFLLISMDEPEAERQGLSIRLLGFPVLRLLRLRRDLCPSHRRRAARLLAT